MATMHVSHPGGGQPGVGPNLESAQKIGLGLFGVAIVGAIAGYVLNPGDPALVYRAYLTAFMVAGGLPVACLALLMLHHMVGGEWGVVTRRLLEAGMHALPYMLLLGIPIWALMMPSLYPWARPDLVAHDHVLQEKAPYLNRGFFYVRLLVYYALWMGLVFKLTKMTREQESTREHNADNNTPMHKRLNNVAGPGLVALVFTVTFASFDWSMSTDPYWFSTIFGLITLIGWVLTVLCICVIALSVLKNYAPMNRLIKQSHFHDLGNLIFAFTCLWAYMSFSQFIIIWSGNLPEEIPWFVRRMNTSWGAVMAFLGVCHFFLPFFLLLVRKNKKGAERLRNIAIFYLFIRITEQVWTVEPNFAPAGISVSILDYLLPAGFIGLFVALMTMELKKQPLMPVEPERIRLQEHH